MKKHLLATCAISLLLSYTSYAKDLNDDYPMSKEERDDKEMGSILGNDGIVLRPGSFSDTNVSTTNTGVKNDRVSTHTNEKVNEFLWQAAKEVLDVAPLTVVDAKNGILTTDWYIPKEMPNVKRKYTVKIKGPSLSSSSLEVKLQQKIMKNGSWVEEKGKFKAASDTEVEIVKRAKELESK